MIDSFSGNYQWLSNFAPCEIIFEGVKYPSTEVAYQAAKTVIHDDRVQFETMSPVQAKRAGKKVTLRFDWKEVKLSVMRTVCTQKFNQSNYKALLIDTGDELLVEGNTWHDNFWGSCTCRRCYGKEPQNHLGILIMKIRKEINNEN